MTEPAANAPRPRRGTEVRQRYRRISYRVLESEYLQVEAAASDAGLTLASYSRMRAVPELVTASRHRPSVEDVALVKIQRELNRIGGNIHQLLRHVNFGRIIDTDGEITAAFAGFREGINLLRELRGRPTL
jgi:hypothetical protein